MPDEPSFLEFDPDDHALALEFLRTAEISIIGRLQGSSNATLAVNATVAGTQAVAVYKPASGERPLEDFPFGTLPRREVATYLLSEALGWHLVPPTVLRDDLEYGEGSLQLFIPHDAEEHAFTLFKETQLSFREIVLLDELANNADRKAGHVIRDVRTSRLWAIDNGLTFHVDPKLRTVLWPFACQAVDPELLAVVSKLQIPSSLGELLSAQEAQALQARINQLLEHPFYAQEPEDRYPYPWPPI